jgi:hypothetical protein
MLSKYVNLKSFSREYPDKKLIKKAVERDKAKVGIGNVDELITYRM